MVLTMRGVGVACTVGRHDLGYVEGGGGRVYREVWVGVVGRIRDNRG